MRAAHFLLVSVAACAGLGDVKDNGEGGGEPALTITSPASGATVTLGSDADKSVPIAFRVDRFTLKEPGTCGEVRLCGSIAVRIDDQACDISAPTGYNNYATASPINASFARCAMPKGAHKVTLEIRRGDNPGSIYTDGGKPITKSIDVTAE